MSPPKVNENSSMDVARIFTVLENTCNSNEDRPSAYFSLARYLKEEDGLINPYIQVRKDQLLNFLLRDSIIQNDDVMRALLQILQFYISERDIKSTVMKESTVLQVLIRALKKEHSDEVNNEILNCLAFQKFQASVITAEVPVLIERLEEMYQKKKVHSDQFVERLVDAVFRLEEQLGSQCSTDASRLVLLVIQGLVHPLQETRMRSQELATKLKPQRIGNDDFAKNLVKTINADFSKNLKALLSKDCKYMTDVWSLLLDLVGKAIHKGSTINTMLQIMEPAFKGSAENRIFAFKAWRSLIDNFALDPDVLSEPKRIRLIMMVMKVDNAKTKAVAMEKLVTWWYFVTRVSSRLSTIFEQIVHPLFQFCAGNSKLQSASTQHVSSPWMSLTMSSPGKHGPTRGVNNSLQVFQELQILGCEIAGHILSKTFKGDAFLNVSWTLDPLPVDVFSSPASFVKQAPFLISAVYELFNNVGSQIEESLVLHIWRSLSNQLRCALDANKMECRESFSAFLSHLHAMVQADIFKQPLLFKMLLSSCNFSQKILSSTAFNIGGGYVRGCPALLLTEIMFMPVIIKNSNSEQYVKLFSSLVNAGVSNRQGALVFLQAVADLVDSRVHDLQSSDFLWRLWSTVAHTLHEHITSTSEVNQGDALEYNFGCLYSVLLLPIKRQLASKVSQAVCKTIFRTWKELYHTFARLSALVTTAEANTCVEELSSKIIQSWQPEFKDPSALEILSSVCQKMLDCVDFSALSVSQSAGNGLTLSPSKWAKRRSRPMGNLHSFVHLLAKIQSEINNLFNQLSEKKIDLKHDNLSACVNVSVQAMVEICTRLFSHITPGLVTHVIASLCPQLSYLYSSNIKTGPVKVFVPSFMAKLEKLWQEIVNCVTGRYSDQYDSYFLGLLSPMLEETFLHSRRGIKSQTLTLWSSTFSKSSSLVYPDNLKIVLCKVKEKTALVLPGWIMTPEQVIAETPFSESQSLMSQGDSQVPLPILPGLSSPKRTGKNSFIARDLSPGRPAFSKISPAKVVSPKEVKALFSSSRKNISMDLNMMSDKEFVVITSPPKRKRRLLTEHQKEVLKEKSAIPAMYNNLDASVDISLSNFDTQQESLSCVDVIANTGTESQDQPKGRRSIRGKSVRISEMKADSKADVSVSLDKANKITTELKNGSRITRLVVDDLNDPRSLSNLSKKNAEDSKLSQEDDGNKNVVLSSETVTQNSSIIEKDDQKETEPAAFKMFRIQAKQSPASRTVEEPGSSNSEIQPRRVSLRKVRSYDLSTSSEDANDPVDAGKPKSPRRVPLRRLNEQQKPSVAQNTEMASVPVTNDSNKSKTQETLIEQKDKKTNTDMPDKTKTVKSSLDNWLMKGKTKDNDLPPKESLPAVFGLCSTSLASKEESFTLVEDTQSPTKMNREKIENPGAHESIAETPPKSDDNASPSPRTTRSVRKLFTDPDSFKKPSSSAFLKSDASGNHRGESKSVANKGIEAKKIDKDSEISSNSDSSVTSSQGFDVSTEIPAQDIVIPISTVNSKMKDNFSDKVVAENNTDKNHVSEYPESQILLDSPSETPSSGLMSMMALPMLTSQPDSINFKSTESSSSARTSRSNDNQSILSSEKDFDLSQSLSQSTLKDECSNGITNEDISPRCSRLMTSSKSEKPSSCVSPDKVNGHEKSQTLDEVPLLYANQSMENSGDDVNDKNDQMMSKLGGDALIEAKETSEKNDANEMLIIGEVTPDVKSPSESSPIKRSSTTKSRRKAAKRLSEHLTEETISEVSEPSDVRDDAPMTKIAERRATNKLMKTQSPHPSQKRLRDGSPPRSVGSKHLLRTRTKVVRRLSSPPPVVSPPKKRRILKRVQLEKSNPEDADDLPLSSLKKRRISPKSSTEGSDDDKPLSTLLVIRKNNQDESTSPNDKKEKMNIGENAMISNKIVEEMGNVIEDAFSDKLLDNGAEVMGNMSEVNNPEEKIKQSDAGDINQEVISAPIINIDRAISDIPTLPDAESMEAHSPSLLLHTTQVTVSSQGEEKMEVSESSHETSGSDEVFEKEKGMPLATNVKDVEFYIVEDSVPKSFDEVIVDSLVVEKDSLKLNESEKAQEITEKAPVIEILESEEVEANEVVGSEVVESRTIENEKAESTDSVKQLAESEEILIETPVKDKEKLENDQLDYTPSEWSPSKSPSCSILKKPTPSSDRQSRRVSFAEPVVSGESPVREKYHSESLPSSPLISNAGAAGSSTKFSRSTSSPGKLMNRGTPYRRRLEGSLRKSEISLSRQRRPSSQSSSSPSQNSYRNTQESQLDAVNPIFPDLVDCKTPLDNILPQLTSSLWHRGLCQLMKGRNLHTIGDLSSLTEVEVNQMPIRHPKVKTVRDILMTYLNQHGNSKGSKSIFACAATPVDSADFMSPKSTRATLLQEVTPSSIADEGMKILPSVEEDLSQLSPIRDPSAKCDEEALQAYTPAEIMASGCDKDEPLSSENEVISSLSSLISASESCLNDVSMTDLFDIHQKLNALMGVVVGEMKLRHPTPHKPKE